MEPTEVVAITFADGSLGVMQFFGAPDAIQAEIDRSAYPSPPVSWRRITDAEYRAMGQHRDFRAAWKDDGGLTVDMAKARDVTRNRLRKERGPMLDELDVDFLRAVEGGEADKQRAIAAEKVRLRDITRHPAIEAAKSLDDLRKVSI